MKYLRLLRVKHYIKNVLVLLPLFFSHSFMNIERISSGIVGIFVFCIGSSAIYIFNDISDVELDRLHPRKQMRPIAKGEVPISVAYILCSALIVCSIFISVFAFGIFKSLYVLLYLIVNLLYSKKLKKQPIADICCLASCYLIRILYGGVITGIKISDWLILVILTGALFMALGKRRNEMIGENESREVLAKYTYVFLDKFMYVNIALFIVFYALWSLESSDKGMIWTTPLMMIIVMRYCYKIEVNTEGNPVEVFLSDKILIFLAIIFIMIIFNILYVNI